MRVNYIENYKTWEKEFQFYVEVKVRFSETDMYGHLNNTVPFVYFEFARIEYFKSVGFTVYTSLDANVIPVVADLQCDFLQQIFFDETLRIYVKTAKIGNSSLDLHYMAKNEKGEVCLTGRGAIVQIDKNTGKSVPLDEKGKLLLLGK